MLKKFSERIGFTQTEIKVAAFLIVVLIIGFTYKTFLQPKEEFADKEFNYAAEDSTFISSGERTDSTAVTEDENNKENILELSKKDFRTADLKVIPAEKSININKANLEILSQLPGVGKKTAEKIILLRSHIGGFKKLDDLLQVKGIGNSKLAKIKKYAYIE